MGAPPALTCAICGRSLLVGERPVRFSPDGREYLHVCPLCKERAIEYGWFREGGPSLPLRPADRRRSFLARLLRSAPPEPPLADPILRRLSSEEQAIVEAAELFNQSPHRRTVDGLTRSLGRPQVSIVPLSGVNPEVVITICWEISWYQYRVTLDASHPVQLAGRGYEPAELAPAFTAWNAELNEAGAIVPNVAAG